MCLSGVQDGDASAAGDINGEFRYVDSEDARDETHQRGSCVARSHPGARQHNCSHDWSIPKHKV